MKECNNEELFRLIKAVDDYAKKLLYINEPEKSFEEKLDKKIREHINDFAGVYYIDKLKNWILNAIPKDNEVFRPEFNMYSDYYRGFQECKKLFKEKLLK